MKIIFVFIQLVFFTNLVVAQKFQEDFQKYFQNNDTINQFKTLKDWETANPKDPELFTSYFNYYFNKSQEEILIVSKGSPSKSDKSIILTDSLDNYAGFIGSQINYDKSNLKKGLDIITKGISLFPNRLDMRFGKIYVLGKVEDWNSFTNEILNAILYSSKNNNEWTWTNNEKKEDGEEFFLSSLQDYQMQLYNTGNDDLLINMRKIANQILSIYPNHVVSLSNLSVTYLLIGEFDKGIEPLLKAEKIDSKDYIVLMNIAEAYNLKNDKNKAIEYYEKAIQFGTDEVKEVAKEKIEELKK